MMCDNLSLYKTYIPSSPNTSQFYPIENHEDEHRTNTSIKRKLSDYEDNQSSLTTFQQNSSSFNCNNSDDDEENEDDDDLDEDDEEENDDEGSSGEDEIVSDDESNNTQLITRTTTPCTITQRRHSDTIHTSSSSLSYGTPIVKRRCTYSCMYDEEQKRSVLVESYRKLRGVKKPKLQVSLLICNLIKRLEKTFTKSPPLSRQQQISSHYQHQHVQYYQHRTSYRSSSSDSIYMAPTLPASLDNDEIETTPLTPLNQQYSPPHSSMYDSDKVLLPGGDMRSSNSMYHSSSTDAYWLAQSNFAVPVVSTSDEDDVDVSLQGGGDYLDLSDNTLTSSFSSCPTSSPSVNSSSTELISTSASISNDCCCSTSTSSPLTKLLVDTNNNNNDDYYIYHHHQQQHHHHHLHHHSQMHSNQDLYASNHHSSTSEQAFFYHHHNHHHHHHNGTNTVDIITTA
ncbi:hypothetical protein I4U23_017714 [Adineta vaga]|nr:hypothetical protein I4U23_017714 [Adineta vaga]